MQHNMHQFEPKPTSTSNIISRNFSKIVCEMFAVKSVYHSIVALRRPELDRLMAMLHIGHDKKECDCELHRSEPYNKIDHEADDGSPWSILHLEKDDAKLAFQNDGEAGFRVIDFAIPKPGDGLAASRPEFVLIV
jgi:hypothetical protein